MEKIIAFFFEFGLSLTHNPGLAVLILSLCVTLCLMPIQYLIDYFKKKNASIKADMKAVEDEIERCYSGQTKFMYLQTLYRQHHYNPLNNFISLVVPLIQIPFFLAAYSYLSHQSVFNGVSFLGIKDLSRPDGIINYAGLLLNLLPILMTLANLLNIEVVSGEKKSEKSMLRYLALFFLLALYAMPSALVLYWMMNNIWLLIINLIKNKKQDLWKGVFQEWKESISKFIQIRFYLPELAFSAFALAVYFLLIAKLNPTPSSMGYMLAIRGSILCSILGLVTFIKAKFTKNASTSKFSRVYFLFLLSTFPVVHYAYENIVFLNATFIFELVLYLLLPVLALFVLLKLGLSRFFKNDFYLVFSSALVLTFFITPVWVSIFKVRIEDGFWFQMLLLLALFFILTKVYFKNFKLFATIAVLLFGVSFGRFSARLIKRLSSSSGLDSKVQIPNNFPKKLNKTPDIYFLIYDAYIGEKFAEHLNINNSEQFKYLKEKGFTIYEDKVSLDRSSLHSIAPVYSMGKTALSDRKVLVGYNPLDKFLKTQGYETYYVAKDYFFREEKDHAKGIIITPNDARNTLLDGILQGEFKFETISRGYDYNKWKVIKKDLLSRTNVPPRLIYTHSPYPGHAQFSGTCLKNEVELYEERLKTANEEMKADIDNILKHHPDAIIITAGDHGPYLTGDCYAMNGFNRDQIKIEHILDRYGIHLAIRWPTNPKGYDQIDNLQGVFFSVLSYLSEDKELLKHQPTKKICLRGACLSGVDGSTYSIDKKDH